jgi:flagellar motor switch protein FliG
MSSLYEFYIEKEIRELTNAINSAKYINEEQKEAMISVLEDADDDMKAAREKKKREADRERNKKLMPNERPGAREADIEIQRARKGSHN